VNARTGAELFQSQQIGLDCLDRFAGEREALRASLEVAMADPAGYGDLRSGRPRARDRAGCDRTSRGSRSGAGRSRAQWKQTPPDAGAARPTQGRDRRAEAPPHRGSRERGRPHLADPSLRAAEALVAAAAAWGAGARGGKPAGAARDDAERPLVDRERDEADTWLATTGWPPSDCSPGEARRLRGRETASPAARELLELERLSRRRQLGVLQELPGSPAPRPRR